VKVVSNASLLPQLYGELYLPDAVWNEVVLQGRSQPGAAALQSAAWIRQCSVKNAPLVLSLTQELGAGEAEAIVLAQELPADLLLVDERHAREKARRLGVRVTGALGVLMEAKSRGLLSAVKPVIQDLRNIAGFHASQNLVAAVLRQAGES